jgi:hypothetical protein
MHSPYLTIYPTNYTGFRRTVKAAGERSMVNKAKYSAAFSVRQRSPSSVLLGNRIRFHFCPDCGSNLYWEGDRNPAVCGVAVGAFDPESFPPPSDSIWEASMHRWLGLPSGAVRHERGRPPTST